MAVIHVNEKLRELLKQTKNYKYYEKYQRSQKVKGMSEKSLYSYECYFIIFLKFLHEKYDDIDLYSEDFADEAVDIMEDYMIYLKEDLGNNKKIINTKISAVSSFYHWSMKRKIIKNHPFDGKLERVKGALDEKIRKPQFLTPEQIDTIKRELATNDKYDLQDQVLFSLVIDSANRVNAIHQLKLSNLNMNEMLFEDVIEKGSKTVEVVFEEETKELIQEWLDYRKENLDKLEVDSLFITRYRGKYHPMAYGTIQAKFSGYGVNILDLERFGMHDGRKSKANALYEETGDLTLAQQWLNHADPSTTLRFYVKPKSKSDLRKSVKEKIKAKKNSESKE